MSRTNEVCIVCKKIIPFGSAYVSIKHNIEQKTRDVLRQEEITQIISSEEVLKICSRCGRKHKSSRIKSLHQFVLKEIE